ncbi:MAG: polysaccharide biosynthesis protein [Bacteroidales bacterium]|nr:polysaccharide biosynthesis protein [Bacteroidales bacterium]
MTERLNKTLNRAISGYLDTRIVFAMDFFMSVMASILVLALVDVISDSSVFPYRFRLIWVSVSIISTILVIGTSKTYRLIIRYTTLKDVMSFVLAGLTKEGIMGVALFIFGTATGKLVFGDRIVGFLLLDLAMTLFLIVGVRIIMIEAYNLYVSKNRLPANLTKVLIAGTSAKSVSVLDRFFNSGHYCVTGFVTTVMENSQRSVSGYPVFRVDSKESLSKIVRSESIGALLFTTQDELEEEKDRLVTYATECGLKVFVTYGLNEYKDGKLRTGVREVRIEDVLGRDEIVTDPEAMKMQFKDKAVLVTGAAGSIGSELCRQLAGFGVGSLIFYDNAETPLHNLRLEFEDKFKYVAIHPVIGDVRMENRLDYVFRKFRPDIVFHAAAYKHVPLMEDNPCEAVLVNDYGTMKVADKCVEYGVEKMVMISTDKAVNPTNVMGCSKRIAEIYVQSLGLAIEKGEIEGRTKFVTTRFGNVLGSNGSVIPRFKQQIENGGPVTVTHPDICRFFMTIPEACRLVMEAASSDISNRICVFDMGRPVKIADLAKKMILLSGYKPGEDIEIVYTGLRPGEKLYEEVLCKSEDTDPTSHDRVRIARVREYKYEDALALLKELCTLANQSDIISVVRHMKSMVPEFISKNSVYEQLDVPSGKKKWGGVQNRLIYK